MGGSRKILGERNISVANTLPHDETFLSQPNVSLASTGSYNDFQVSNKHGFTWMSQHTKPPQSCTFHPEPKATFNLYPPRLALFPGSPLVIVVRGRAWE